MQEGISQQAASARLRALEARYGLTLIDRGGRAAALTPEGALVAQWATDVLDAGDRFEDAVAALRPSVADALTVAASLTIAEYLLPGWLVALREHRIAAGRSAPLVRLLTMNSTDATAAVRAGRADLGFLETPDLPAHLIATTVATDELVVVVRPDHPWAAAGSVSPIRLASTPLVMREAGSGTRHTLESLLRSAGADELAPPAAEFSTTAGVRAAALAGLAPAALSVLAVQDDLTLGRLVAVRVRDLRLVRPLTAISSAPITGLPAALVRIAASAPVR